MGACTGSVFQNPAADRRQEHEKKLRQDSQDRHDKDQDKIPLILSKERPVSDSRQARGYSRTGVAKEIGRVISGIDDSPDRKRWHSQKSSFDQGGENQSCGS